jgi:hypothetical protein
MMLYTITVQAAFLVRSSGRLLLSSRGLLKQTQVLDQRLHNGRLTVSPTAYQRSEFV